MTDKYILNQENPSQNYDYRIKYIVLHYTVLDLEASLKELTVGSVSSHYLVPKETINQQNIIFQLVPEDLRAWTQGVSYWKGRHNINDTGIGIEIVNAGNKENPDFEPFTEHQINLVIELCRDIILRYKIAPTNIIGHADVSPGRKIDPGPLFPWQHLYNAGIGAWPDPSDVQSFQETLSEEFNLQSVQELFAEYGYKMNTDGTFSEETKQAVIAFQMHFRPSNYDGNIDKETRSILQALLKKYPSHQ